MPLAILNDAGDELVRIHPDLDEAGLVPVRKVAMSDTTWALVYGSVVLQEFSSESACDTQLGDLMTHLNARQANSAKTVAQIEALI